MLHEYTLSIESPSLQLSNQEYRDILMNAPIGIFTATPEGKILGMNPAFVGMLDYDSSHELMESVKDIGRQFYADPKARKEMMNCLEKNGEGYKFESRFIRKDGSGYPQGLPGNETLIESRILAVADVVEAMMSHRPYRPARAIDTALHEIEGNRGVLYDTDVTDACLKLFREKDFQFRESLSADDLPHLMR